MEVKQKFPNDFVDKLRLAELTGQYIVFAVYIDQGKVKCERTASGFPLNDIATAKKMIVQDLAKIE